MAHLNILAMAHKERVAHFSRVPPKMGSAATEYRRGLAGYAKPMSAVGSVGYSAFMAGSLAAKGMKKCIA